MEVAKSTPSLLLLPRSAFLIDLADLKASLVKLLGHQNKSVKHLAATVLPEVMKEVAKGIVDGACTETLYRQVWLTPAAELPPPERPKTCSASDVLFARR